MTVNLSRELCKSVSSKQASLSSNLKLCEYEYYSLNFLFIGRPVRRIFMSNTHNLYMHNCENKFNHDFINNCSIRVAMGKNISEFSLK